MDYFDQNLYFGRRNGHKILPFGYQSDMFLIHLWSQFGAAGINLFASKMKYY